MTRSAIIAFACSISLAAHAMADDAKRTINVPSGDLAAALDTLAKQSGTDLVYRPEQVQGLKTRGVHGELSTAEAVARLLEGTPLTLSTDPSGAMLIAQPLPSGKPAADPAPAAPAEGISPDAKKSFWHLLHLSQADGEPAQSDGQSTAESQDSQATSEDSAGRKAAASEEVVVTGSRIRRTNAQESAQDVKVYGRQQIEQSGQSTVSDFLNTLPDVSVSVGEQGLATQSGGTTVQLHGLPTGTTLVLINGRRVEPSALQANTGSFFDLNNIPVSAIERIEVVSEGASAVYGSDAIAGVVNIILRSDINGAEANLKYGGATGQDEKDASLALGKSWDRGAISIIGNLQTRGDLYNTARSITSDANYTRFGGVDARYDLCPLANVFSTTGQNLPGTNSPYAAVAPGSSVGNYLSRPGQLNACTLNGALIPRTNRVGIFAQGHYDLTSNVSVFFEAVYSHVQELGDGGNPFLFGEPGYAQYTVSAANPYNPYGQTVGISQLWNTAGPSGQPTDTEFFRPLVGARGSFLSSWEWEVAAWQSTDWDHYRDTGQTDGYTGAIQAALDSSNPASALDPFIDGPPGSAQTLRSLLPDYDINFRGQTQSVNGFVRGTLWTLPSGPIDVVVGTEYDHESYYQNNVSDPLEALGSTTYQRNTSAVFGEGRLPILAGSNPHAGDMLALSLAGRYDHNSQFGSATTPQYGFEFRPVETLLVRGTYGKSFRAPTLVNLDSPVNAGLFIVTDPLRGNAPEGVTALSGGNARLRPETGQSRTIGIVYTSEAIPDLKLAATWWSISEQDDIQNIGAQVIVDNAALFPGAVVRAATCPSGPPCPITEVNAGFQNFGATRVAGFDYQVSYQYQAPIGVLTPTLGATNTYRYLVALTPAAPATDAAGRAQDDGVWAPRWKGTAALSWALGPYSAHIDGRYVGPYVDYDSMTREIGNFWLTDANFRLAIGALLTPDNTYLKSSYLEVGGVNLLNRLPQYSNLDGGVIGYDPFQADLRGRFLYVQVGVKL
jgi:iron complex outermembrane receptor protein